MVRSIRKQMAGEAAQDICTALGFENGSDVKVWFYINGPEDARNFVAAATSPETKAVFRYAPLATAQRNHASQKGPLVELSIEEGGASITRKQTLSQFMDEAPKYTDWPKKTRQRVQVRTKDGRATLKMRWEKLPPPQPPEDLLQRFNDLKISMVPQIKETLGL
jgi:hypothetical protein